MAKLISAPCIAQAWEQSLALFDTESDTLRFNSQRGPCVEAQDILFDVQLSRPDQDFSPWYPNEFHALVDSYAAGFLNEEPARDSTVAERLYRWTSPQQPSGSIDQAARAMQLLIEHPNTRYNVLAFWDPIKDGALANPVSPLSAHIKMRHSRLAGTLFTRTVDAWLGAFPMLVGFARLIRRLAAAADVEADSMRILIGSYHVYEMDLPILQSIGEALEY